MRSKSLVLGLIRDTAKKYNHKFFSIIRPVPTRWTAYYLAYNRLLDLKTTLELVVTEDAMHTDDQKLLIPISGDSKAHKKAREMVGLLKEDLFWEALLWYVQYKNIIILI